VLPPPAAQILAPTDDAFDQLLTQMGGGNKLPESALLARPELRDILQYHVLPGMYTSGARAGRARVAGRPLPLSQGLPRAAAPAALLRLPAQGLNPVQPAYVGPWPQQRRAAHLLFVPCKDRAGS
jgi:hypothetical protein